MRFRIMNFQPDAMAFSSDSFFFHSLISERVFGIYRVLPSSLSLQPKPQFLTRGVECVAFCPHGTQTKHTNTSLLCSTGKSSRQYIWRDNMDDTLYSLFFLTSNLATAHSVARRSEGTEVLCTFTASRTDCSYPVPTTWRTSHRSGPNGCSRA